MCFVVCGFDVFCCLWFGCVLLFGLDVLGVSGFVCLMCFVVCDFYLLCCLWF